MSALEESERFEERLARIEHLLEELTQRVERLERARQPAIQPPSVRSESSKERVTAEPPIPPPPVVPPLSEEIAARVIPAEEPETPPPPPPPAMTVVREKPTEQEPWEQVVGGRLALWVGLVATFLALGFFLAYAWRYLSDAGRLAIGFAGGAILLAVGEYSRTRVARWFSEGISGAGIAVLYLSIWAGAQRYGIFSFEIAFVLMALTVILGVVLALRYDAISLSVLATIGGFLTPALLGTSGARTASPYPFLTYVTVLNAGILVVSLYRNWQALVWLAFTATVLLLFGWAVDSYETTYRWQVFAFVTVNFALYLATACWRCLVRGLESESGEIALVVADAGVYALAGYALIGDALGKFPGLFALALAILFGMMSLAVHRQAPRNGSLRNSLAGIAFLFLMWAMTHQTYEAFRFWYRTGDWQRLAQMVISLEWTVVGALLLVAGIARSIQLLRIAGLSLLGVTALKVFLFDLSFLDIPMRVLSFGGLGLTLIGISWLYSRYGVGKTDSSSHA